MWSKLCYHVSHVPFSEDSDSVTKASRFMPAWSTGDLPPPPLFDLSNWKMLIGPGLIMVGGTMGAGEWLFGPIVTARYGGVVMWLATISITLQVAINLAFMRYTLYSGEPIFVGFLRTAPGPKFWLIFYLIADSGHIWPYAASNAAVPLAAAWLGHLPGPLDDALVRNLGYVIFLVAFIPLIFGGKVYNAVERIMTVKVLSVFGYLLAIDLFLVSSRSWVEIFSGFFKFGFLPKGEIDWASLAAFAGVAGVGGLGNTTFSNYVRDKGWGMGSLVGAIPSLVRGRKISLSHTGKVFPLTARNIERWRGWLRHIRRDALWLWGFGSLLGMALPSMLSLEFLRGADVTGHAAAAMTARGIAEIHGEVFWFATLLCGFVVLGFGLTQVNDSIVRRWTDVFWGAAGSLRSWKNRQVKNMYYFVLLGYCLWGLLALRFTPNPLFLAIVGAVSGNIGLGIAALHALYVNRRLMPDNLRPPWYLQCGLVASFLFFLGISIIALYQALVN